MTQRSQVAVVGIGCRFPGGVTDAAGFWRLLESGTDAIGTLPPGRFDVDRFLHPEPGTPGKLVTAEGGFLQDIDRFDAAFFGLSPREARKIDPQHRLLLEVAWEALEDAGIPPSSLAGRRVGVYVGVWSGEYENVMYRTPEELDFHSITGGGRYAASGRISYALDLRGPALTVDTGCSASLVALHLAHEAVANGDAELAIVGAANLVLQPHVNIGYSRSGMLSVGGRCRFGDAGAGGYVRSDGVGAIVLKPLAQAKADRDPVRGVILAAAVNADGRGSGQLATPSAIAQAELLETVYARAGVDPSTVPYVEAHGTGTRAGDPVELEALGRVLGRNRAPGSPLIVGSVKTNIGHTEAAAGMAGVIKTLLALQHGRIPANLHLRAPNETVPWGDLNVQVPAASSAWPAGAPRIAGVSSFGITGTNAHVVLAAPHPMQGDDADVDCGAVVLSARSASAVEDSARLLLQRLEQAPAALRDVSYTSTCRREHHEHRLAFVTGSVPELVAQLRAHLEQTDATALSGSAEPLRSPRLGFVFSGQGSQWLGMGRELLNGRAPEFAAMIDACDALLREHAGWSLRAVLAGEIEGGLERVDTVQPTLACVQIALAAQLRAWGIVPSAVVGHSMGEVAAAHGAGALSLEDAVRVIVARSRLLARIAGQGAMALVDLPEDEVLPLLVDTQGRVSIAAINGPRSTVISGDPELVDALVERLDDDGVFCRRVRVDVASHSVQTDPLLAPLAEELSVLQPRTPEIAFHSTARAGAPTDALLDASYWVDNLRRPVRLLSAVQAMIEQGIDTFIEIAPHPVLLTSLGDIAAESGASIRALAGPRREEPELRRLLELVARAHVIGVPVQWERLASPAARVVPLPHYAWQRERHWLDIWEDWSVEGGGVSVTPRPETSETLYEVSWKAAAAGEPAPLDGTWLIVRDRGGVAQQLRSLLEARGASVQVAMGAAELAAHVARLRAQGATPAGVIDCEGLHAESPEASAVLPALRASCGAALASMQELVRAQLQVPTWWVTRRAQPIPTRAASAAAWPQAATWGLVRTLWQEHPELDAHAVDVDGDDRDVAEQVVLAVTALRGEPQLAFDAGAPYCARLVEAPQAVASPPRWRSDSTYLVTGGLGALGLLAAEELVRGGARRLVLLSRTPLPPRSQWSGLAGPQAVRTAGVLRLESLGASVHLASVDAGDDGALRAWYDAYRAEQWPAIRGVVHCAGMLDNRPLAQLTLDSLETLLRGKPVAAANLAALLPDVEHTVYFSSSVTVLPHPSQANYAAANAALDALAAVRTAAGHRTVSLSWGVWKDTGLVADERIARYVEMMEARGLASIEPDAGRALLQWTMGSLRPHVVIAPTDWARARPSLAGRAGAPFYDEVLGQAAAAGGAALKQALADAPDAGARRTLLIDQLRALVARVLSVAPADVAANVPLGRQGLDSLMALEFRTRLEHALELRLPASLAWNYPLLESLADHLLARLNPSEQAAAPAEQVPVEAQVVAAAPVTVAGVGLGAVRGAVAELSDDEVLSQLQGDA